MGGIHQLEQRVFFAASLLTDFDPAPATPSTISEMIPFNGAEYFVIDDRRHGADLWKTDGTTAGTIMVRDIAPGLPGSSPRNLRVLGNQLLFFASDGVHGEELWKSNGTPAGTQLVTEVTPGPFSFGGTLLSSVVAGNWMYFSRITTNNSFDIWKTDGTAAGTSLFMASLQLGGQRASRIGFAIELNGSLIFSAASNVATGLFVSDGTTSGTTQIAEVPVSYQEQTPAIYQNRVFFNWYSAVTGAELWSTDGTSAGTTLVKDVRAGASSSSADNLTVYGDKLYFINEASRELWVSDGTNAGTTLLTDINPGTSDSVSSLIKWKNMLYFLARDSTNGQEVWSSDGTAAGTRVITPILPAFYSIPKLFASTDVLYYPATLSSSTVTTDLYQTDGTAAGTSMVKSQVGTLAVGNSAVADASLGSFIWQGQDSKLLWHSDGSTEGTSVLASITEATAFTSIAASAQCGGVIFMIVKFQSGFQLWRTDGTSDGTLSLLTLPANAWNSNITSWSVAADFSHFYFAFDDSIHGLEPWVSDGTVEGTHLLKDIYPGATGSSSGNFMSANNKVFFGATDPVHGHELWRTDGTEENTLMVAEFTPGSSEATDVHGTTFFRGEYYFTTRSLNAGAMLYATDGTAGGTRMVCDPYPGSNIESMEGSFAILSDSLVFLVQTNGGNSLWKTDGVTSGPIGVPASAVPTVPFYFAAFNGYLYYMGGSASTGGELCRTDGTAAGTSFFMDFNPGPVPGLLTIPNPLRTLNDRLLITVNSATLRSGFWISDGTPSGTVPVTDVPAKFPETRDRYFTQLQLLRGVTGIGAIDGTADGTQYLAAIEDDIGTPIGHLSLLGVIDGMFVMRGGYTDYSLDDLYISTAGLDVVPKQPQHELFDRERNVIRQYLVSNPSNVQPGILTLTNRDTNTTLSSTLWTIQYNLITQISTIQFTGFPMEVLPDGNYRASFPPTSYNSSTNPPPLMPFDFFVLAGDANGDRRVDMVDFNQLTGNFGLSNATYSRGDFTNDAIVDSADFNLLIAKFGNKLASAGLVSSAESPASSPFSDIKLSMPVKQEVLLD